MNTYVNEDLYNKINMSLYQKWTRKEKQLSGLKVRWTPGTEAGGDYGNFVFCQVMVT